MSISFSFSTILGSKSTSTDFRAGMKYEAERRARMICEERVSRRRYACNPASGVSPDISCECHPIQPGVVRRFLVLVPCSEALRRELHWVTEPRLPSGRLAEGCRESPSSRPTTLFLSSDESRHANLLATHNRGICQRPRMDSVYETPPMCLLRSILGSDFISCLFCAQTR